MNQHVWKVVALAPVIVVAAAILAVAGVQEIQPDRKEPRTTPWQKPIDLYQLLCEQEPWREYSLYIGYLLPEEPDLAVEAAHLESECLNKRAFCDQGCQDSRCEKLCEHAFRRCIRGIPGAEFYLAWWPRHNCHSQPMCAVKLEDGMETKPYLNRWFYYLETRRPSKIGIFYTIRVIGEMKECHFYDEEDGTELDLDSRFYSWLCGKLVDVDVDYMW